MEEVFLALPPSRRGRKKTYFSKQYDQIKDEAHGTLVAENTIGVYHDHFINYYLDFDIDGDANSFVKINLVTKKITNGKTPRKSYWTVEKETVKTELDARILLGTKPMELRSTNFFEYNLVLKVIPPSSRARSMASLHRKMSRVWRAI
ncbi:hypothetical protein Q3G72_019136 [Acer saccharum]|nr:hypothetical protein Q3G72_019136 [Acer saccharum]